MGTHNPENERIKRNYFTYLKEAKRYSEASVDKAAEALHRFEKATKFRSFKTFHIEQAIAFKRHLSEQVNARTGAPLSKATLYSTLAALKSFFLWLAGQPGFRSRLSYSDAEYFSLSEKETRVAKARREVAVPTIEQIRHVLDSMPADTEIEKRDRALIAFTLLTGARDGAIASCRMKHVDIREGRFVQDARDIRTKFSKTFTTAFFPVGDDVRRIVEEWVAYLTSEKLWGPDDPLFPSTQVVVNDSGVFAAGGLSRKPWSSAAPIRRIFREAFQRADLPYFNPHTFRNTLALLGERICRGAEELKAWSQNLGHERTLTTLTSYGTVPLHRQQEIIRNLKVRPAERSNEAEILEQVRALIGH